MALLLKLGEFQLNASCTEIVANAMACQMASANLVPPGVHLSDINNCRPRKSVAGVIFCVGGRGTTGDPFRSIEAYDWRRNKWTLVSEMGTKRRHVGVVSAAGRLFAIGYMREYLFVVAKVFINIHIILVGMMAMTT